MQRESATREKRSKFHNLMMRYFWNSVVFMQNVLRTVPESSSESAPTFRHRIAFAIGWRKFRKSPLRNSFDFRTYIIPNKITANANSNTIDVDSMRMAAAFYIKENSFGKVVTYPFGTSPRKNFLRRSVVKAVSFLFLFFGICECAPRVSVKFEGSVGKKFH